MAKMTPEQEASYALDWDLPRSDLSMAAQLEYDRLARERKAAGLSRERERPREQRGSWLVTKLGRYARPVTGDQVRNTTFATRTSFSAGSGYNTAEVDDLLRHIADELDAGRPAEPLIRNAAFRKQSNGYDIGAVDWFLGQLLFYPGPAELAELSADPWRDLGVVAQFTRSGIGDLAGGSALPSWLAVRKDYSQEYRKAWHDFDQQPGTHLLWATWRNNLRTMEKETIASLSFTGRSVTLSAARRKFTLRAISAKQPPLPGVDAIAARSFRDFEGHFAAETTGSQNWRALGVTELVDDAGAAVLYTSGRHFNRKAAASISFPDRRWLRFPVRGTGGANAIMTAVDEAGNSVARYRLIGPGFIPNLRNVEISVHPGWELTDELVLAIAISAPWLGLHFAAEGGGG
jgi:DivIVA domain-containing protein